MKRPLMIIFSVVGVFLLISFLFMSALGPRVGNTFSNVSRDLGYGGGGAAPELYAAEEPAAAPMVYNDSGQFVTSNDADIAQQVERKVIKNADLAVVVKDPEESMKSIAALAEKLGGYVVSSNLYQSSYGPNNIPVPEASVSIRIPAEKLTEVLEMIKKDAVEVEHENISGQDVTDQYVDLTSRLTAKQAAEKKLLEILEQATETEDVLAVYQQLQQIQSEIEVLKGQIKYIDESAAMSSVSVRLIADETVQPIEIGGWKLQGTAKEAIEDLVFFTQSFTRFLIRFVIYILPSLILIAIPLYLVYRGGRALFRRFGRAKTAESVKEEKK
ncbi:MAG: DUF4349 domain-containing protein [Chloroflexi bacterium]|nr:DUF4349 domain-containing protein [Chloroflexota bacterium]